MTWMPRWFAGRVQGSWELERDRTAVLPGARGEVLLRVERGLLLVTREGDAEDHVLAAGQALVLPAPGKVVAWALEPARATFQDTRLSAGGPHPCDPLPARA